MKIEVTQEHIDSGIPAACNCCPIALAISEETGESVTVGGEAVHFQGRSLILPREVSAFIHSFDADGEVEPFSFELDV